MYRNLAPKTLLGFFFFRDGEGGVNWIVYVAVLGSVFILYICYSCIITRCLCCRSENQQAEVDTGMFGVIYEKHVVRAYIHVYDKFHILIVFFCTPIEIDV